MSNSTPLPSARIPSPELRGGTPPPSPHLLSGLCRQATRIHRRAERAAGSGKSGWRYTGGYVTDHRAQRTSGRADERAVCREDWSMLLGVFAARCAARHFESALPQLCFGRPSGVDAMYMYRRPYPPKVTSGCEGFGNGSAIDGCTSTCCTCSVVRTGYSDSDVCDAWRTHPRAHAGRDLLDPNLRENGRYAGD